MNNNLEHFRLQVYYWVKKIPKGKVASYGQIARLAGFPRHARHVSKALGAANKALKLPWHRVISAQGTIAFDKESNGYARQQSLLEKENIKIVKGKINLQQYAWTLVSSDTNEINPEEFFK